MAAKGEARKARPSIYDVAERAGVSHMTVSRVLNGHPNIKSTTRDKVMSAIETLDYRPSSIARALATRRAMRIGVLVDSPIQFGPNSTLRAIERAARGVGYAVSAYSISDGHDHKIDAGIIDLVTQGVDALCLIAPRSSSMDFMRRTATSIPTVVVAADPNPELLTVGVDQREGASAAVRHLLELGHRRILHIAGPLDWLDARAREQAWREAMEEAGLHAPLVTGDWTSDFGYQVGRSDPIIDEVTAVFAANDQTALGLVHGLADRGLRVPEDISVVGFDDLPDARHFLPPLTTVRQDFEALGEAGVRVIMGAIAGEPPDIDRSIHPTLMVRASTSAPAR